MGKCILLKGGGSADVDNLTATPEYVLSGYTALSNNYDDSDNPLVGTMANNGTTGNQALNCGKSFTVKKGYHAQAFNVTANTLASQTSATATAGYIYNGKTAWVNGSKITGTMTVNSLLSFSVAANSGRRVLATWKNPTAATGKPYSGVYIRYSTSGYPGKTGGTQVYKGAGNNTSSGGTSTAYLTLPSLSTTYYLSAYPYVTCSAGEITGNAVNASVTTSGITNLTITGSRSYTIPAGFTKMDVFCVGGGSSGRAYYCGGGGGGSGYTSTVKSIGVSAGQVLNIVVGSGGAKTKSNYVVSDHSAKGDSPNGGGISSITINNKVVCSANGGEGSTSYGDSGCNGGSGGGPAGYDQKYPTNLKAGCTGGSNGGNGNSPSGNYNTVGKGQGTTTKAFGEASGILYAGGGGGGAYGIYNYYEEYYGGAYNEKNKPAPTRGGTGGANGGGRGGDA